MEIAEESIAYMNGRVDPVLGNPNQIAIGTALTSVVN